MSIERTSNALIRTGIAIVVCVVIWLTVRLFLRGEYLAFSYVIGCLIFLSGMLLRLRLELSND